SIHQNLINHVDEDELYDRVVSLGEVISSQIIYQFLLAEGIKATWLDARNLIRTDSTFREGQVNWDITKKLLEDANKNLTTRMVITQGFIGADGQHRSVTLGREGSDFTAAIIGSCLRAESVTIWKDVPGVMNADPKRLPTAVVFP